MLDALATESHFRDHLQPIWDALPDGLRGTFHAEPPADDGPLTLVASYGDLKKARRLGRRVVLAEHGAGQSYIGSGSGSYIGSPDRAGCVAVLVPGADAAARHEWTHPTIPAYEIGCPKLDTRRAAGPRQPSDEPVVAISFHWECRVVPETRSAFRCYSKSLIALKRAFPNLIGHGHPRMLTQIQRTYTRAGIEVVSSFDEVLDRADVYCVDNSSTLFEFASLDRPVVVMNAPWYRRTVSHGLRFWECADVGVQANNGAEIVAAVRAAIADTPAQRARRLAVSQHIYGNLGISGTDRAVRALEQVHERWEVDRAR